MAPLTSRQKRLSDARVLLDWLEAHPAVPLPDLNLAAFLHMSPDAADVVLSRASSASRTPFADTPAGGKVLRCEFGSASYRLVVLPPPPPHPAPTHIVTPYEPRRTARLRKPKQRQRRSRTLTERTGQ